ncbi:MAG: carbohydrate ABC transporter permease [Oscillospiraceae bacterium]|nr:carbohydrate ABC transporter permease [Oscillospiraceae bacterium]
MVNGKSGKGMSAKKGKGRGPGMVSVARRTTRANDIFNSDTVFQAVIYIIMCFILIITLYPLIFIVSASFSDPLYVNTGQIWILPKGVNIEGYRRVFRNEAIWTGYRNTVFYTVCGTVINLFVTTTASYALSKRSLAGRNFISLVFLFTMFFSGGMIPTYMVVRNLHLLDTVWAMMLPGAMSISNMIIMRTFFQVTIPDELTDAARIDGCSTYRMFIAIVLPLSGAILAVMALFYGVSHWNTYFDAMIYLNNRNLFPLQLFLREILMTQQMNAVVSTEEMESIAVQQRLAEMIKFVVIIVSTLPVLLIYPFMQKYFVRGVMIGSIKG